MTQRIKITIEVDTDMKQNKFNEEVLKKIAANNWPIIYLATEIVDINNPQQIIIDKL